MTDLPSGTVTFLFTDIEGSTRLLHHLGDEGYADALAEHRRSLRDAFARNGGVEVDTQGDAFFVAFATAHDALATAAEAHEALSEGPVRVRIGVHTGTPLLTEEGYVGADLHRAARIAAAAHGGQTVVSAATAELARDASLIDLGLHRFKDLASEERVFQLGPGEFPPLKSLYRTNLPVPATPFLGRQSEVREVVDLVTRGDVRLVTLTGPGGTGKTRLALQAVADAADTFPDGLWWVPLAPLRDPAVVPATTANALGVAEQAGREVGDVVAAATAGKQLLLLFDNAEHLLPDVVKSIASHLDAEGPTVVVTSRERLRIQAEHTVAVPSLSAGDARQLFVARARQVDASFEATSTVDAICERVDELPLAIELAAARTALFSPEQLLERLSGRLDLLKGGRDADARQETLRATITWSFELLEPAEQRLFSSLAVFAGGCTFDAAEEVCRADADTLQSLLDKSLVRRRMTPFGPRYWMLETIRDFAVEQLERLPSYVELQERHGEAFASLAERADPHLRRGPGQQEWGDRIAEDIDNFRAAVRFGLDHDREIAARIIGNLTYFFWTRGGFFAEARALVDETLERPEGLSDSLVGRVHECGSCVCWALGDAAALSHHANASYAAFARAGDEQGMADGLRERGKAALLTDEDLATTEVLLRELATLAERIGDRWNFAIALNNLGDLALHEGDWPSAVELCARSSEIRTELGDSWGAALALVNVATARLQLGEVDVAAAVVERALRESLAVGATMIVSACVDTAVLVAAARGEYDDVALLSGIGAHLQDELGATRDPLEAAMLLQRQGEARAALGEETFEAAAAHGAAMSLENAAEAALRLLGEITRP
jgi:predicted ATPase/class 3 adenylate cyclase